MRTLFFDSALLPSGWASDVAIGIDAGAIISVAAGNPPADAERVAGIAVPGMVNLPPARIRPQPAQTASGGFWGGGPSKYTWPGDAPARVR